ncbi:MAG: hypothetical protein MZV49_23165 [Rhodopseudomonas palustris]|nr:hypothetical protein [Rhodopseudomonas palustris]
MWRAYDCARLPRILVHRDGRSDAPVLRDPRCGGGLFLIGALIMAYNLWMHGARRRIVAKTQPRVCRFRPAE